MTPAERIASIEQARAAVPEAERPETLYRRSIAARQQDELWDAHISTLRTVPAQLTHLAAKVTAELEWSGLLNGWRGTLIAERNALPPLTNHSTPRENGLYENLTLSLMLVDQGVIPEDIGRDLESLRLGELMRDAGVHSAPPIENQVYGKLAWFGSLREVNHRLAQLEAQRVDLQKRLDDALLTDEERAARDAERQAFIDAERAQPRRKTRADQSQYDLYPDGRTVEVAATT
jgi:hypothetical protein